ncbi:rhomboid domain-containing protein 2 [Oryzias melastigma]|uniref:rhomboid domain-containing protein 2 n=1 Tax=Oryzias melastigma TaxID=30732 RepID=UPI000CF7C187|nr:rhomboid domain-containing protein 2 [Oryzias melastigma]
MKLNEYLKMVLGVFKDCVPAMTCGGVVVVLLSCVLFAIQTSFSLSDGIFSLGAAVLQSGRVHVLVVFPFYHRTAAQLLLNAAAVLFLCGGAEKGVGTIRFLLLFLLLSATTGLLYSFLDLLQDANMRSPADGSIPVTLSCVAVTAARSKMPRSFMCGLSFPTMALPFALLVVCTALIPRSVLPCNVIAVLVGLAFGAGWFSLLDMSEARAAVLEKVIPFRFLKTIRGVTFVPASVEERRKTLLPQINPSPGSYPVQSYAPLSSVGSTHATPTMHEGWQNFGPFGGSGHAPGHAPASGGHSHGHDHGHNHGHSHGHFGQSCNHSHGLH